MLVQKGVAKKSSPVKSPLLLLNMHCEASHAEFKFAMVELTTKQRVLLVTSSNATQSLSEHFWGGGGYEACTEEYISSGDLSLLIF